MRTALPDQSHSPKVAARVGRLRIGGLGEPVEFDVEAWFAEMDAKGAAAFLEDWERDQPTMPVDKASFG